MGEQSIKWSRIFLLLFMASLLFVIRNADAQMTTSDLLLSVSAVTHPKTGRLMSWPSSAKLPKAGR